MSDASGTGTAAGLLVARASGTWAVGVFAAVMAVAAVLGWTLPGLRQAMSAAG